MLGNIESIPGQRIADLKHNIKFLKKIKADYINILILHPVRGTDLYDYAKGKGYLLFETLDSVNSPQSIGVSKSIWSIPNLSEKLLNYYIKKTYILYFLSPSVIFRYLARYFRNPFRLLNAIKNSIHRFNFKSN